MNKLHTIALLAILALSGCAQSTTKSDFDCPIIDGVPACLTTEEADTNGDIPKPGGNVDVEDALNVESEVISTHSTKPRVADVVNQPEDTSYKVEPLVNQPERKFGGTERMWFAAWEDKKNDVFIDQQYIYWSKPGNWIVSEVRQ